MSVPLPHSSQPPYRGNYWGVIEKDLRRLSKNPTWQDLQDVISKNIGRGEAIMASSKLEVRQLSVIMQRNNYIERLVPVICNSALKLPTLFPTKHLEMLQRGQPSCVSLSRDQVSCLVANMFLCTFLPCTHLKRRHRGHFVGDRAPTGPLTFVYWHLNQSGATETYLESLMNYFTEVAATDDLEERNILYKRVVEQTGRMGDWHPREGAGKKIVRIEPFLEGRIGDEERIEMDFANENVGFGTTATQEELILGTSPETCPIVLFNETLDDNEAIVIVGAKKYGDYSGYGRTVRYEGSFPQEWTWSARTIIAIDAVPGPGNLSRQLTDNVMDREIRKAVAGFSAARGAVVATGHWGCGAFGGDMEVKCLVQILAASMAGVDKLEFFCFGERDFYDQLVGLVGAVGERTTDWLWDKVLRYRSQGSGQRSLLEFIATAALF